MRLQQCRLSSSRGAREGRPFSVSPPGRLSRRVQPAASASDTGGSNAWLDSVKRIAKKVQGALPVVGLVSRLASPEGGFDEVAYPEFCRSVIDGTSPSFRAGAVDLERLYGKQANTRWMLLVLWMVKHGAGLVPPRDVIMAARRLRVSNDLQVEMERFEAARDAALTKYKIMERPKVTLEQQLGLATDALATLLVGLKDGEPVPPDAAEALGDVLRGVWPSAAQETVIKVVEARPQRAYT